jgi:hypothetical protein
MKPIVRPAAINPVVPTARIEGNSLFAFFKWERVMELVSEKVGV